jgi:hypothetical protein
MSQENLYDFWKTRHPQLRAFSLAEGFQAIVP